jgi:hypothetical protein
MRASVFPLVLLVATISVADDGFVPVFNGRDLNGWVNVDCAPETWGVKEGMITCTGKPTGAMRTVRQYENYIFECEWRHLSSGGNAGIFIWAGPISAPGVPFLRAIEVQVLENAYGNTEDHTTHGDVFPIHGSTMVPFGKHRGMRSFPSEQRSKPTPEWNHYRIEANNGVLRLSVNGKEVSGGEQCVWRKGYLALESEGGPTEWRNLQLKELPSRGAKPEESAPEAQGHRALYTGLDLRGWKAEAPERWESADWRLLLKAGNGNATLATEAEFGDCEIIVDAKLGKPAAEASTAKLTFRGHEVSLPLSDKWQRFTFQAKKGQLTPVVGEPGSAVVVQLPKEKSAIVLGGGSAAVELANIYVREL